MTTFAENLLSGNSRQPRQVDMDSQESAVSKAKDTTRSAAASSSNGLLKFSAGLATGCLTGFATQVFHNAALTGGRMTEVNGTTPTNMQCMRQLVAERGLKAVYLNFPLRVGVIAGWSAILNVAQPFCTTLSKSTV